LKSTLSRAIVLSLALGGLFPLIYSSFNCLSVEYRTPMDVAKFYALPYEKQQEWLRENEVRVTGLKCLDQRARSRHFWQEYAPFAAYLMGLVFVSCMLMARWERSRLRSNSTPHSDARDMPAPASDSGARAGGRER
jgi:hypothetical protein